VSEHPKHRMKWIIWKWKFAESLADALSPLSSSERRRLSATAFIAARHEGSLKAECHRLEINRHGRELQQQIAAGIADATLAANLHDALNRDGRRAEKHLFDPTTCSIVGENATQVVGESVTSWSTSRLVPRLFLVGQLTPAGRSERPT